MGEDGPLVRFPGSWLLVLGLRLFFLGCMHLFLVLVHASFWQVGPLQWPLQWQMLAWSMTGGGQSRAVLQGRVSVAEGANGSCSWASSWEPSAPSGVEGQCSQWGEWLEV